MLIAQYLSLGTVAANYIDSADAIARGKINKLDDVNMKLNQKHLSGLAGLVVVLVSGSSAYAITLNDSGTADNWIGLWQTGHGGEFYVAPNGPVNNSAYDDTTRNQGGISDSFQTFCLEYNEYLGGSGLSYVVNDKAVGGGVNVPAGTGDTLSRGTAWLYSQFAQGTLSSYNFANTGDTRASSSAALLQNAIWALEDEIADPTGNIFFEAAAAKFGDPALAKANYATGEYGVWVLNMTKGSGTQSFDNKQDMLFFARVPDGGSTLILLGLGLGGISLLVRHKKLTKAV